jgi:ferredoxin-type protein NapF
MNEVQEVDASRRAFLRLRTVAKPEPLHAVIGDSCLNLHSVICDACKDSCATKAIQRVRTSNRVAALAVNTDLCTGCGDCVSVCPNGALSMSGTINVASSKNE